MEHLDDGGWWRVFVSRMVCCSKETWDLAISYKHVESLSHGWHESCQRHCHVQIGYQENPDPASPEVYGNFILVTCNSGLCWMLPDSWLIMDSRLIYLKFDSAVNIMKSVCAYATSQWHKEAKKQILNRINLPRKPGQRPMEPPSQIPIESLSRQVSVLTRAVKHRKTQWSFGIVYEKSMKNDNESISHWLSLSTCTDARLDGDVHGNQALLHILH